MSTRQSSPSLPQATHAGRLPRISLHCAAFRRPCRWRLAKAKVAGSNCSNPVFRGAKSRTAHACAAQHVADIREALAVGSARDIVSGMGEVLGFEWVTFVLARARMSAIEQALAAYDERNSAEPLAALLSAAWSESRDRRACLTTR